MCSQLQQCDISYYVQTLQCRTKVRVKIIVVGKCGRRLLKDCIIRIKVLIWWNIMGSRIFFWCWNKTFNHLVWCVMWTITPVTNKENGIKYHKHNIYGTYFFTHSRQRNTIGGVDVPVDVSVDVPVDVFIPLPHSLHCQYIDSSLQWHPLQLKEAA